jgi:hypothetical protein
VVVLGTIELRKVSFFPVFYMIEPNTKMRDFDMVTPYSFISNDCMVVKSDFSCHQV